MNAQLAEMVAKAKTGLAKLAAEPDRAMTSHEIAALTGKLIYNVNRDIRSMAAEFLQIGQPGSDLDHLKVVDDSNLNHLGCDDSDLDHLKGVDDLQVEGSDLNNPSNRQNLEFPFAASADLDIAAIRAEYDSRGYVTNYSLNKSCTMTLVTGYSARLRKAVVDRWLELEKSVDNYKRLEAAKLVEIIKDFDLTDTAKVAAYLSIESGESALDTMASLIPDDLNEDRTTNAQMWVAGATMKSDAVDTTENCIAAFKVPLSKMTFYKQLWMQRMTDWPKNKHKDPRLLSDGEDYGVTVRGTIYWQLSSFRQLCGRCGVFVKTDRYGISR